KKKTRSNIFKLSLLSIPPLIVLSFILYIFMLLAFPDTLRKIEGWYKDTFLTKYITLTQDEAAKQLNNYAIVTIDTSLSENIKKSNNIKFVELWYMNHKGGDSINSFRYIEMVIKPISNPNENTQVYLPDMGEYNLHRATIKFEGNSPDDYGHSVTINFDRHEAGRSYNQFVDRYLKEGSLVKSGETIVACEKNDVDLCDANIRLTVTFDEKYSDSNFFGNPRPLSSSGKA
ncbi:hypothetical protein, partial [Yersinia pestis]